jgi:hypothetical protein
MFKQIKQGLDSGRRGSSSPYGNTHLFADAARARRPRVAKALAKEPWEATNAARATHPRAGAASVLGTNREAETAHVARSFLPFDDAARPNDENDGPRPSRRHNRSRARRAGQAQAHRSTPVKAHPH